MAIRNYTKPYRKLSATFSISFSVVVFSTEHDMTHTKNTSDSSYSVETHVTHQFVWAFLRCLDTNESTGICGEVNCCGRGGRDGHASTRSIFSLNTFSSCALKKKELAFQK